MDLPKNAQEKIQKLQLYEQKMTALLSQRQEIESQLLEVESAIEGINNSKDKESFQIVGNVMIKFANSDILKNLEEDKNKFALRVKALEKQENEIKSVSEALQKEVMKTIEGTK
jgi:prefoldin beta subunit